MILAAGLELLGFLDRLNRGIEQFFAVHGEESLPQQLPDWSIWLAAVVFACGLAIAILASAGHGRRVILWLTALVLVSAWAPVLCLAAYAPAIAGPWIATMWSGICALVYTTHHCMACDSPPALPDDAR